MPSPSSKTNQLNLRGVTPQIFLLVVLPITVLLLVVAFGSYSLHQGAMRSMVADRDLSTVRAIAGSLELQIQHRAILLQLLAQQQTGTSKELLSMGTEWSQTFDGGLFLFSSSGALLARQGQTDAELAQAFIQTLPASLAKTQISPPYPASGTWLVWVASPTPSGALLVGGFDPTSFLHASLSAFDAGAHDGGGHGSSRVLVAAPPASLNDQPIWLHGSGTPNEGAANSLLKAFHGESGIDSIQTSGGEHLIAFSPIPSTGWGVAIEEAWEDISDPLLQTTQIAPLVLVPAFLLALLALWFGTQGIVLPLRRLEKQALELAKGDFESIRTPAGGIEEIQNLQRALVDMAGRLQGAQQALRNYINSMTTGIEKERYSLARELHDDTIQSLIALNQRLQLSALEAPPQEQAHYTDLQSMVQGILSNLRQLIRGVRPIYLEDLGLATALEMLVQESRQTSKIDIRFICTGAERRLDPQAEMSLYRLAQEGLRNLIQHSQASEAQVKLEFNGPTVCLEVNDNGQGFVLPPLSSHFTHAGHFGLLGLKERAVALGADLTIETAPGHGTRLTVIVHP